MTKIIKKQTKIVEKTIKKFYADEERKLIGNGNIKKFYEFVNTRLKSNTKISSLLSMKPLFLMI